MMYTNTHFLQILGQILIPTKNWNENIWNNFKEDWVEYKQGRRVQIVYGLYKKNRWKHSKLTFQQCKSPQISFTHRDNEYSQQETEK